MNYGNFYGFSEIHQIDGFRINMIELINEKSKIC